MFIFWLVAIFIFIGSILPGVVKWVSFNKSLDSVFTNCKVLSNPFSPIEITVTKVQVHWSSTVTHMVSYFKRIGFDEQLCFIFEINLSWF